MSAHPQPITCSELEKRLRTRTPPQVLDVRPQKNFQMGHIPGAKSIPAGDLRYRYRELDSNRPIVVVCQNMSNSYRAGHFLLRCGYEDVAILIGGMLWWQGETEIQAGK